VLKLKMGKNKNKKAVQAAKPIVVSSEEDEEFGDISSGDEAGDISGSGDESGEYSEMFESGEEEMGGAMTDGTTIISCKYNGGILLAADGRSSNVSQILKFTSNHQFYRLLEHVCW
jgi:hypothetical protein